MKTHSDSQVANKSLPAFERSRAAPRPETAQAVSASPRQLRQHRQIAQLQASASAPSSMPHQLVQGIGALSGQDLSDVRVHRGSAHPAGLGAEAYAQGQDIYLAPGREKHLPHEAWHIVQQRQGRVRPTGRVGDQALNDDKHLETEADTMGARALQMMAAQPLAADLGSDGAGGSAPSSAYPQSGPIQRKIYFGSQGLSKKKLGPVITAAIDGYVADAKKAETLQNITNEIWKTFGASDDSHMEIGNIVKAASKVGTISKKELPDFLHVLGSITPRDINTPENFHQRISNDTRLSDPTKLEYQKAFNDRANDPGRYAAAKKRAKQERQQWVDNNSQEADVELKTGDYFQDIQEGRDFRTMDVPTTLTGPARETMRKVEARVLGMKDSLMAAWYYNQTDADKFKIFDEHELRSVRTREKLAGKKVDSKSMSVDVEDNKTGHYFYSFIEHEDTGFNTNTRFTQPATADGQLGSGAGDDTKRRLRTPLRKNTKAGAIMMGGDLADDKQEQQKMGLSQNATPNKLFGSGSDPDKLEGLLRNYVRFVENRIYQAMPYTVSKINPFRSYTTGEVALQKLDTVDSMSDMELWEYLVRQIAQPQLMTPSKVSTSMKAVEKSNINGDPV